VLDDFVILSRVAGELLARSSAIKRYIGQLEATGMSGHSQLIATIHKAIDKIERELDVQTRTISSLLEKSLSSVDAENTLY
jgi:hypothetical protein